MPKWPWIHSVSLAVDVTLLHAELVDIPLKLEGVLNWIGLASLTFLDSSSIAQVEIRNFLSS